MKFFGLFYLALGILYAFYVNKQKEIVSAYSTEKVEKVLNQKAYFKLQWTVGMINSAIIAVSGLVFFFGFPYWEMKLIIVPVLSVILFNINNTILFKESVKRRLIKPASDKERKPKR